MDLTEQVFYHQIHPAKLAADVAGSVLSTYLVWHHKLGIALASAFAPALLASALVLRFADVERLKHSALGQYMHRFMNRRVEAWRFGGQVVVWIGAWYHRGWLILTGVLLVVAAWASGLWQKPRPEA